MAASKTEILWNESIFNQGPQILQKILLLKIQLSQKIILVDVCQKNVTAPEATTTLSATDLL